MHEKTALQIADDLMAEATMAANRANVSSDDYDISTTVRIAASTLRSQYNRIAELEAELAAAKAPTSNSGSLPEMPATPWYPDDSGEWVEVPEDLMEMPTGLKARTLVSVLFREERQRKSWASVSHSASAVLWIMPASCHTRIVAYKVVKP